MVIDYPLISNRVGVGNEREYQNLVLLEDNQERIPLELLQDISEDELRQFKRLVRIIEKKASYVIVEKNHYHRIGRFKYNNLIITVPPPFDPDLFVDLLLYASSHSLDRYIKHRVAPVNLDRIGSEDLFIYLLVYLFAEILENKLSPKIAKLYERRVDKVKTLRGRLIWQKLFGHHPVNGIPCSYYNLSTDNLLNSLILAGLESSILYFRDSPLRSRLLSQIFLWRSLTKNIHPAQSDYDKAIMTLNRHTEHYYPALELARAITIGYSPDNPFYGSKAPMQSLEFSLPSLFEKFVSRLLKDTCSDLGLDIEIQYQDRNAIIDGRGKLYRKVQPDVILLRNNNPIAVIDAKYKPRYVNCLPRQELPMQNRVTNADLYQLYFYQARVQSAYRLSSPPPAAILAPQFPGKSSIIGHAYREIYWQTRSHNRPEYGLKVIPLPLSDVLKSIKEGKRGVSALSSASELVDFLYSCADT